MSEWFIFEQNDSACVIYDEVKGMTQNVYIESEVEEDALSKLESLGVIIVDRLNVLSSIHADSVPAENDLLPLDSFVDKLIPDGYDAFVHPLGKQFYGAYKETEPVPEFKATGYGMAVSGFSCTDIFPVGDNGWDEEEEFDSPSPGRIEEMKDQFEINTLGELIKDDPDLKIMYSDANGYYTIWSSDELKLRDIRRIVTGMQGNVDKIAKSVTDFISCV